MPIFYYLTQNGKLNVGWMQPLSRLCKNLYLARWTLFAIPDSNFPRLPRSGKTLEGGIGAAALPHSGPNPAEKIVGLRRQIPMWHIKGTYKYNLFITLLTFMDPRATFLSQSRYKIMYVMVKISPRAYKKPPRPFYETLGFASCS